MASQVISDIGEKQLVREIISLISDSPNLHQGIGHDSAFLNIKVADDEVLLMNTDRSGTNIAYQLGIANGECVGDFAVSHAVSDIIASGGTPVAVSLALLMPKDTKVDFVKEVVIGADKAAKKYGSFIACGDTKNNPKFAIVATAIGKCRKDQVLTRSGAKEGDHIVVSGNLGTMVAGLIAFKKQLSLSSSARTLFENSLIFQNPPFNLGIEISARRFASACTDNSDGLSTSIHSLCESSGLGATIFKQAVPIHEEVRKIADLLKIDPFQLALASGDWQHIYAVPENNIKAFMEVAQKINPAVRAIGKFTRSRDVILEDNGISSYFKLIENDRIANHESFMSKLTRPFNFSEQTKDE